MNAKQKKELTKRINAYARAKNIPARAVRESTQLMMAVRLEHAIRIDQMSLAEARQLFIKYYPETEAAGPKNVAHYIGDCKGECRGLPFCPAKTPARQALATAA